MGESVGLLTPTANLGCGSVSAIYGSVNAHLLGIVAVWILIDPSWSQKTRTLARLSKPAGAIPSGRISSRRADRPVVPIGDSRVTIAAAERRRGHAKRRRWRVWGWSKVRWCTALRRRIGGTFLADCESNHPRR